MTEKNRFWLTIKVATIVTCQLCPPQALFAAPTAVIQTGDFNFGKIAGGSGHSGTVTIATSGARSYSGSVIPLGTAFSPARFTITGNAGKSYSLTLPAGFTIVSGANQMNVSAVTSSVPVAGLIPAGGSLPFVVGGTLTLNSAQQNGAYSGTLIISVK